MTPSPYEHDRAGMVSTAHLELEQARHERNARRTVGQYVPWSRLAGLLLLIGVALFTFVWIVAGPPPVDFNPWSR